MGNFQTTRNNFVGVATLQFLFFLATCSGSGKGHITEQVACEILCPRSQSSAVVTPYFGGYGRSSNKCNCPQVLELNCGKNMKTYTNHCVRTCAKVALAYPGKCLKGKANIAHKGLLEARSTTICRCPKLSQPNCGTDGVTYRNHCLRKCLDVALAYTGACKPAGNSSVGNGGSKPPSLNSTNQEPCQCAKLSEPNCGIDGKTYENNCLRLCAGVALAHAGACKEGESGTTDGTVPNSGVMGRSLQTPGSESKPKPTSQCNCPMVVELNCGVDGKTYGNYCLRQCAGVALAYGSRCVPESPK